MIFYLILDAIGSLLTGFVISRIMEVSHRTGFYHKTFNDLIGTPSANFQDGWNAGLNHAASLDEKMLEYYRNRIKEDS